MPSLQTSPPPRAAGKIVSRRRLRRILSACRREQRTVVFTNGCFDLLHAGHVKLLERARRLGDVLVVGLNSDRSVRRLKGPGRPVIKQGDRALLLAAMDSIDYVTIFGEATPARLIASVQPDILIKGADWNASQIIGADVVRQRRGRIVRFPVVRGYSTSEIIARIQRSASTDATTAGDSAAD